jgi:phosphoglycerate dehydrogenase-like enzyme
MPNNHPLKIWSNVKYTDAAMKLLREVTAEHELLLASDHSETAAQELLTTADIAFGQPKTEPVKDAATLRWVHLDSAGYDRFDTAEMRAAFNSRGAVLTGSSQVYNEPCAEHALALMMALARRLPESFDSQRGAHDWKFSETRAKQFLLRGQTALLLGYGAIGQRLAELLAPFAMNVIAVRRHRTGDEPVKVVTEAELDEYLPLADHVVSSLPSNAGTAKFINAARLARMKRGAIFYNIGRGSTVDQEALLDALASGRLAAAFLDVTDPEPLPPSHPLWTAPNCFITPHTAGGHVDEKERLVIHFKENLDRFISGDALSDRIY